MTQAAGRPLPFISTPVDFLLVGGLSILHLCVVTWFGSGMTTANWAIVTYMLSWVINYPHFSATTHRLYQSRENILQFPVTSLALPFVIIGLVVMAMLNPDTVAPWFIKLFLLWSSYHFSAQSLGVTLLYAHRAGLQISPLLRRILSTYIFSTFISVILLADNGMNGFYYGVQTHSLGVPQWIGTYYLYTIAPLGFLAFCMVLRTAWVQGVRVPLLFFVPFVAQTCWFVLGRYESAFQVFVPAYHSLQYLLIAWAVQLHMRIERDGKIASPRFAFRESSRWYFLNILGGAALFSLIPWLVYLSSGIPELVTYPIMIAGVQIHHFFVDGVIWKLRTPNIRHPLMTNWSVLTGQVIGRAAA